MLTFLPLVGEGGRVDDGRMFPIHCDAHGREVLLPYGRIRLENTDAGIAVHYRCTCGHEGVELLGRARETAAA
jgi:hypothetical protein